ncbi:hypothetical protein AB6887_12665 [Carnobacterium divergens]|uniref:DUF1433 domain-containing protein n=1 Tax=Carnobacterium divergens TaxID=2748 RepID=A0A7Z8G635_CARDV|nr:hypothetical protein [Carnobacterium divergens]TFI74174.1 hypothetical protein CKN58_02845 [Carnobacterium divergens]TFI78495.1 hypothetical protein CKN85_02835 [Carnobacterium divergens]TFI85054.1 hypothetical protein CKN56_02810 [Carnobacterium divergens]TFI97410.1 hypothetical protein CKN64_02810 [Carnobacterium divergens]TFJ13670.1 hypothetical protein CKN60_02880 [Carnobacterium divergens]
MNKKRWWLFSLVAILIIGIGGETFLNKEKEEKKLSDQELAIKKKIAVFISQNYENVETISFGSFSQTKDTGTWHIVTTVNSNSLIQFDLNNLTKNSNFNISYNKETFFLEKKKQPGTSLNLDEILIDYGGEKHANR